MKKTAVFLIAAMIINLLCTAGVIAADTSSVFDDAVILEGNENIAGYNNVVTDSWGDFADNTFFQMESGDTEGNTYIIMTTPDKADIENFTLTAYKYQEVAGDFTFASSLDPEGPFTSIDVADPTVKASAHAGFGELVYSHSGLSNAKYVKVTFPADNENWRVLIANFKINENEQQGGAPTGSYSDDAVLLDGNDSIAEYNNVNVQNWGDFSDDTFFGMIDSDISGNTYIIVKAPDNSLIKDFSIITYKHMDVSGSFTFASSADKGGPYTLLEMEVSDAAATPQGGFGEQAYSCAGLEGVQYIKVTFPADTENWRAMIASFKLNESAEPEVKPTESYEDDALELEGNPNVIEYSNLSTQSWGDFSDITFYGMLAGDTQSNTYLTFKIPDNTVKVTVKAYKHQDITDDFTFTAVPGGENLTASVSSVSSAHSGFGEFTYTIKNIPKGATGIKALFPADTENWRLMIASFGAEAGQPVSPAAGSYSDDAVNLEDNTHIGAYNNLSAQNWGDFADDTFFGMLTGDTSGGTYVTITAPGAITKAVIRTYKYQEIAGDFTFEALYSGEVLTPSVDSSASEQAGFAFCIYTIQQLPENTTGIKVTFPADTENWRIMLASFDIEYGASSEITECYFAAGGSAIENVSSASGEITADITIKTADSFNSALVTAALYDGNKLIGIYIDETNLTAGENKLSLNTGIIKQAGTGDTIKVFVWDKDGNEITLPAVEK